MSSSIDSKKSPRRSDSASADAFFANLHCANPKSKILKSTLSSDTSSIICENNPDYVVPSQTNPTFCLKSFHLEYNWVRTKSNSRNRYYWHSPVLQLSIWEPAEADNNTGNKRTIINFPFFEIRRNLFLDICHQRFVTMNESFGPMQGTTKTATSCKEEGMKIGLQGMFARFLWNQLLEMAKQTKFTAMYEFAFPSRYFERDLNVEKELVEAGRTSVQAQQLLVTLANGFADFNYIMNLIRSDFQVVPTDITELQLNGTALPSDAIQNLNNNAMYAVVFRCITGIYKQDITGRHLAKLRDLYKKCNGTELNADTAFVRLDV